MQVHSSIKNYKGGRPIVTMGTFDGVHPGHRALLHRMCEFARQEQIPSLVLTFWPHPRLVLSQNADKLRLLTTLQEKTKIISDIGVDHLIVIPFSKELASLSASEFVKNILVDQLNIKHLLIGFNHKFGQGGTSFKELGKLSHLYGFGLSQFRHIDINGHYPSSSKIRTLLLKGEIVQANILLGYKYQITGIVTGGKKLGRSISYPTANINLNEKVKLIPPDGVYACMVSVMGKNYGGMVNIGFRPTVDHHADNRSIEVHILDFNQDIYSEEISLYFISKIREEMTFPNIEALKEQLQKDEVKIREIINHNK